jgi:hypothetical protein
MLPTATGSAPTTMILWNAPKAERLSTTSASGLCASMRTEAADPNYYLTTRGPSAAPRCG